VSTAPTIVNFGGNIRFTPARHYAPRTEAEVLEILDRHARGKVRVVGARHSWNAGMLSTDALVDLRHLNSVEVKREPDGTVWATVGGGCRIKHLLQKLSRRARVTLPTIGLITEQTIAGSMSTGTHGSGRHSISHYMDEIRTAAYDPTTGKVRIYVWNQGEELRAARCAVGCMGIVLSVRFRCIPDYAIAETLVSRPTLEAVLKEEAAFPTQQFFLIPHGWSYFVQRRTILPAGQRSRFGLAFLYRVYWLLGIDIGLHLIIKLLASVLKRPAWTRFFYRRVFSKLILRNVTVVDRAERMLVMEHELFRHLRPAVAFIQRTLDEFADSGSFTHHYPIAVRRVLLDDTLISMACGEGEPYYAFSFITYAEPRDEFIELATFLARSMTQRFEARLHWGKFFPLGGTEVEAVYPRLPEFRAICNRVDPNGVFRSEFVERVLFGKKQPTA
jgi:hypothetical protein